jgi:hypothetical protein
MTQPVQNFDIVDLFNYLKTFTVHEMAKAEKILHSAHTGSETDIEKVTAQGAHALASSIYQVLTKKVNEALTGEFSFKPAIDSLISNIKEIDPFLVHKVQLATVTRAPEPSTEAPLEGEALPPLDTLPN